ncbi:MAG: alpha/beta fold hydrolase [Bacteriovoracaceae bacterium]|nr:alpha/beta fold hydrolase [Bacteriovoracaceae bacterium]
MSYSIETKHIYQREWSFDALLFIPHDPIENAPHAIFTHGYTDHKGSLLNWGSRLAKKGIPVVIFDLPGHYLGSFNEVNDFFEFTSHGHECFYSAYSALCERVPNKSGRALLGGHSLGALLSLRAMELEQFVELDLLNIAVGFGLGKGNEIHVLEGPLFESTMFARAQLVSSALAPSNIFPWLKTEKLVLPTKGKRVHLICGENDGIISKAGIDNIRSLLEENGNTVSEKLPRRLPHHLPDLAGIHIELFIRNFYSDIQLI